MLAMPEGCIAISATSYGSLQLNGSLSSMDSEQQITHLNDSTKSNKTASVHEVEESEQDLVAGLKPTNSARSILKSPQSSGDLDSQGSRQVKRAVSWHDFEGKDLHTVREFTPSEHDDDELLFNPGEPKQCCVIC